MAKYDQGGGCPCGLQKVCDCEAGKPVRSVRSVQGQVWDWAKTKFGNSSPLAISIRGNKEMSELISTLINKPDETEEIIEECADVAFFLLQICEINGGDLMEAVAKKLEVNKKRSWEIASDGSFQHVEKSK